MTSLMGQQGYFPNRQNRFSPVQRQGTNNVQSPGPSPVEQQIKYTPATQPTVIPIAQPTSSIQKQVPLLEKNPASSVSASSNLWQQQAGILLKQYGPSIMRQFGPPLARKVGLPIAQHVGPPLARKVGIPLAQRVGTPLLRKVFLPLAKRAGFALIRRLGLPF